MSEGTSGLILDGVKGVDLTRVVAGPFCAQMLGDMGADVVKVEDTGIGDEIRGWAPSKEGQSAGFLINNRNKRGIAVNMKAPEGVEIIRRLVKEADVLVENFRTGQMEKFGLGYEQLAELNPRLIYCSVSAFGRSGPRAQEAGYEAVMQAFAGIMSVTGEKDREPVRCGISLVDLFTGNLSVMGIICALYQRSKTGLGQRVDANLLSSALTLLNFQAEGYLLAGVVPQALGSGMPAACPYRNYRCADEQWIFIAGANENLWRRLTGALGLSALTDDPRYATNLERVKRRVELDGIVQEAVGKYQREDLLKLLDKAGVPATPVNNIGQLLEDPQVDALNMRWEIEAPRVGKVPVMGFPVKFSRMQPSVRRNPPQHGQHTDEVLKEYSYSQSEIDQLRKREVIL